jgi:hypothetical protein
VALRERDAEVAQQIFHTDTRGFIAEIWHQISSQ